MAAHGSINEAVIASCPMIAILGTTGAGKSTFINTICGSRQTDVSSGDASCTQELIVVTTGFDNQTITLFDTPGFDASNNVDGTTLNNLATWLLDFAQMKMFFNGIIIAQSMVEKRVGDAEKDRIQLLKHLIGKEFMPQVVVVFTHCDKWSSTEAAQIAFDRAKPENWGSLCFDLPQAWWPRFLCIDNRDHARVQEVVRPLLRQFKRPLLVQTELQEQDGLIAATTVGRCTIERLQAKIQIVNGRSSNNRTAVGGWGSPSMAGSSNPMATVCQVAAPSTTAFIPTMRPVANTNLGGSTQAPRESLPTSVIPRQINHQNPARSYHRSTTSWQGSSIQGHSGSFNASGMQYNNSATPMAIIPSRSQPGLQLASVATTPRNPQLFLSSQGSQPRQSGVLPLNPIAPPSQRPLPSILPILHPHSRPTGQVIYYPKATRSVPNLQYNASDRSNVAKGKSSNLTPSSVKFSQKTNRTSLPKKSVYPSGYISDSDGADSSSEEEGRSEGESTRHRIRRQYSEDSIITASTNRTKKYVTQKTKASTSSKPIPVPPERSMVVADQSVLKSIPVHSDRPRIKVKPLSVSNMEVQHLERQIEAVSQRVPKRSTTELFLKHLQWIQPLCTGIHSAWKSGLLKAGWRAFKGLFSG